MKKAHRIFIICIVWAEMLIGMTAGAKAPAKNLSLPELEHRLKEIDSELGQLAHASLRSGIGTIGHRSKPHTTPGQAEWVEIQLEKETLLHEIVLVPAIRRDSRDGFQADGFPAEFRITTGTANDRTGTLLCEIHSDASILPRIAPVAIPAEGITASWVRIEALRLSPRAIDSQHIFQLSEILIFSNEENMALRQPVKVSSSHPERVGSSWNSRYLVDGHTPYLMDAAQGLQSVAYVGPNRQQPILTLDLEGEFPLSRIHLHDVDQDDTVPQSFTSKLGIPRHLRIEGANQADFSDAKTLLETRLEMVNGPIMMWRIPETTCRYVRLYDATKSPDFRIGFAEIELFSNGRNVARGQTVHTGLPPRFVNPSRPLTALTDGRNLFGNILPIRDWLRQLARRHDLEIERLAVMTELNHRYARQKTNLNRMIWLAALLAAGIGFTILIDRNIRMKQQTRIKERFAADLHDEVGANIHTISMLSDLAQAAESPDESTSIHQRILKLTDRTDTAIRYCSNMLEADGLYFGLIEDMKRVAQRISGNFEHKVSFEGEPWIKQLPPRTRIDLFLFYKECLVNISRHSDATQVTTQLTATAKNLHLLIKDNGQGMTADPLPSSLKRRARMLGARMTVDSPPEGGACVTLSLKLRKRFRLSLRNKEHDENSH